MNRLAILKKIISSELHLTLKQMRKQRMLILEKESIRKEENDYGGHISDIIESFSEDEKVAADKIELEWKDVTASDISPTLLAESIIIYLGNRFEGAGFWDDNVMESEANVLPTIDVAKRKSERFIFDDIKKIKDKFGEDIFSNGNIINGIFYPPNSEISNITRIENFSQIEDCYILFKKFEEAGYHSDLVSLCNGHSKLLFFYEAHEIVLGKRSEYGFFGQKFINENLPKVHWYKFVLEMAYIHKILEEI
jgi:hypothetical protein